MNTNTQTVTHSFCWAELNAPDLAQAKAFYGALYGWSFQDHDTPGGPYVEINTHNGHDGGMMPTMPEQSPGWMPYVEVERLEDSVARACDAGGTVAMPPAPLSGGGRIAWIRDPFDIAIGLYERDPATSAAAPADPAGTPWFAFQEFQAPELGRAKAFYGHVFRWSFESAEVDGREYVFVDTGAGPRGGMQESDGVAVPHGWLTYVCVLDLDSELRAAIAAGAREVIPVTSCAEGVYAVYRDAGGACLGLYQATR